MTHKFINLIVTLAVLYPLSIRTASADRQARPEIALVKGMYDDIGLVLSGYRIPFKTITLKDLENSILLSKFDSLFLPSGIDRPIYENIDLLAMGTKIKSVNLKKDYHELNDQLIIENLKKFIETGGSVYFSGYSYRYIQDAYSPFEFFDNFPYIGLPGRITTLLRNDLKRFSNSESAVLTILYPGWVAVKSSKDSETIAEAEFETPRETGTVP